MNRQAWLEQRKRGLGGSDCAAILGLNPWRTPLDVFLSKTQPAPEQEEAMPFHLLLGILLEPVIKGLYESETQSTTESCGLEIMVHPQFPEIIGTPDCLCRDRLAVVELKSENCYADKFGEPGTDEVPEQYLLQCSHYMAITGLPRCDVAILHGGAKFAVYHLHRDIELENAILDQERAFWADYIVKEIEPPIDASDSWRRYIAKKFPANLTPLRTVTESDDLELLRHVWTLIRFQKMAKEINDQLEFSKNAVKLAIGDSDGLVGEFGKITYKRCRDSRAQVTDYRALCDYLAMHFKATKEFYSEAIAEYTEQRVIKQGSRRLLIKPANTEDGIPDALQEGNEAA